MHMIAKEHSLRTRTTITADLPVLMGLARKGNAVGAMRQNKGCTDNDEVQVAKTQPTPTTPNDRYRVHSAEAPEFPRAQLYFPGIRK